MDREVADGLHGAVGKFHCLAGAVGKALLVKRILEAHEAKAHGAVAHVRAPGLGHGVVVDVDDVIEHADGGAHGFLELRHIQPAFRGVLGEVHGTEIAHGDFVFAGVQGDFRAQVRGVHHANVLLGRTQVAAVLEGDPGMAGLKDHGQHFAPEIGRPNAAKIREFPAIGHGLVSLVARLEGAPREIVEVRRIAGGEEGPGAVFHDPLHKEVGDPVRRVHIMSSAAVVAGVLPKLEEFLDV